MCGNSSTNERMLTNQVIYRTPIAPLISCVLAVVSGNGGGGGRFWRELRSEARDVAGPRSPGLHRGPITNSRFMTSAIAIQAVNDRLERKTCFVQNFIRKRTESGFLKNSFADARVINQMEHLYSKRFLCTNRRSLQRY